MIKRTQVVAALVVLVVLVAALGLPWLSPARGAERAWHAWLDDVEGSDFEEMAAAVDADYADGWGLGKADVVKLVEVMRRQFLQCTITRSPREVALSTDKRRATIRAAIRVNGDGTPVARMIAQFSQGRTDEWTTFEWVRRSWKPWDWTLVRIDNPRATPEVRRLQRELGGGES